MSTQISISAQETESSIDVFDCTGITNSANQDGWGLPNQKIEDVKTAILEITPPYHPSTQPPYSIDVYPDLPNNQKRSYSVAPEKIGMADGQIESGLYKIKLIVTGSDQKGKDFTKQATIFLVCIKKVQCCVDKLKASLGQYKYQDIQYKKIIELGNLIGVAQWSIDSGDNAEADRNIKYVSGQCQCAGC